MLHDDQDDRHTPGPGLSIDDKILLVAFFTILPASILMVLYIALSTITHLITEGWPM